MLSVFVSTATDAINVIEALALKEIFYLFYRKADQETKKIVSNLF